jgi:hypothetical protein
MKTIHTDLIVNIHSNRIHSSRKLGKARVSTEGQMGACSVVIHITASLSHEQDTALAHTTTWKDCAQGEDQTQKATVYDSIHRKMS